MNIKIIGTGRSLPEGSNPKPLRGDAFDEAGHSPAKRFYCKDETQIDLACAAANAALRAGHLNPGDIDLLISGSAVPYQPIPAMAPLIGGAIGMKDGTFAAFDVNSTCLSFLTALETAANLLTNGTNKRALVVSSEVASRALPWESQPDVAALFGDGAAAVVIERSDPGSQSGIVATKMHTYPSAYGACQIGAGGTRFSFTKEANEFAKHSEFQMDGKTLFKIVSQHFGDFVEGLLAASGWNKQDVDLVVPHQASPLGLAHLIRQTGFDARKVINITEGFGNQIAASIPFAFDIAWREGRINRGSKVLFLGTSAGVSLGGLSLVL